MSISFSTSSILTNSLTSTTHKNQFELLNSILKAYNEMNENRKESIIDNVNQCCTFAETNNDPYILSECLINLSVCLVNKGRFEEALTNGKRAKKFLDILISKQKNKSVSKCKMLSRRVITNLIITHLFVGHGKTPLKLIKQLIDDIDKENNIQKQKESLSQIVNTLFHVESLIENKDNKNDSSTIRCLKELNKSFKEFLKQKDIVKWIQVMKEEVLKIKVLNEKHQIKTLFLLLFVYEVIKMKVNKLADDQKQQRKYLLKLSQFFDIDEQFIDNMMNCDSELLLKTQNQKVKTFFEIYQLLYIKEKELNGNDSQVISRSFISSSFILSDNKSSIEINQSYDEVNSSSGIIQILLNYSSRFINSNDTLLSETKEYLLNLIGITKEKIKNGLLETSDIPLTSLVDKDIIQSLKLLIENILYIYEKQMMFRGFIKLYKNSRQQISHVIDKKIELFNQANLNVVCNGEVLAKVNYKTKGIREHFYKLDFNNDTIYIYNNLLELHSHKGKIELEDILKITYGISSNNLRKKFEGMDKEILNCPWLFFSIITKKRSYDFYIEQNKLIHWYYGLSYWLKQNKMTYKIVSCSYFILNKIKLKAIQRLKDIKSSNQMDKVDMKLIRGLISEKGIQRFSFIKIILLVDSIFPIH